MTMISEIEPRFHFLTPLLPTDIAYEFVRRWRKEEFHKRVAKMETLIRFAYEFRTDHELYTFLNPHLMITLDREHHVRTILRQPYRDRLFRQWLQRTQ